MDKRSQYFQTIARFFFELRGAPFFLSSKDLDLIAIWEKLEIPLHVVHEGIKNSFTNYKKRQRNKTKILSLSFCNHGVLMAFEQHQERKVGSRRKPVKKKNKRKRIRTEVEEFLKTNPRAEHYLKKIFVRVQNALSQEEFDETMLECIEEEMEELLLMNATSEEKAQIKKIVLEEFGIKKKEEFEGILRIKLIKHLRNKHKIPYISPYYY
ncbi:hypothetical protein ACFLRM_00450 [Acidobacteriota bacterium]